MADKTTAQVRRSTMEYIKAESESHESIDDTLRRLLEIESTEEDPFKRLTAYLSQENTEDVRKVKETIKDEVDVMTEYQENTGDGPSVLLFRATTNGVPITKITTSEADSYSVRYQSTSSDGMASVFHQSSLERTHNWEENLRTKVRGAFTTFG